jgi:hypothetical protein
LLHGVLARPTWLPVSASIVVGWFPRSKGGSDVGPAKKRFTALNYAFIDHFQEIARAHFTVRRLERRYGKDAVRAAYDSLSTATPATA